MEGLRQLAGDGLRIARLYVGALHHVHEFAISENANRRRRRRESGEVAANPLRGFAILTGENRDRLIGPCSIL